ncbi:Hypothetical predicted protein [Podarcis lilfordi]|uniref:Uncharacterized protein n=1 Tax=Podarcis lilfordi TaxID=74358 RepID=A0AA35KIM4_9SAUR|nr:Hypothetical predicted protein [Podarcis lilfordi]
MQGRTSEIICVSVSELSRGKRGVCGCTVKQLLHYLSQVYCNIYNPVVLFVAKAWMLALDNIILAALFIKCITCFLQLLDLSTLKHIKSLLDLRKTVYGEL